MAKVKESYATVGPYPSGIAVKASTALSILAMVTVVILGYFFSGLKSDQEATDLEVQEISGIVRELSQDVKERE